MNAISNPFLRGIAKRPDLALAIGVTGLVAMLIVPLPTLLLDLLIGLNLATAIVLLLAVVFSKKPLDMVTFPTLVLLTTLFRLGLNVSTTRSILASGSAGEMVHAFGELVVGGDIVVGGVIFLILTLVQLLVVGKGAERVAEVSARFALDAMPGEQMSIDAALRSGFYGEGEAMEKREALMRRSQLFGNMDGAMKFVKGDAIFGLIVTFLNLVAGAAIGIVRHQLELSNALDTYAILSIGDAMVSQIPSVIVTLAAGILVTRVADSEKETQPGLGFALKRALDANPMSLVVSAGAMFLLALIPGLPGFPFVAVGTLMLVVFVGLQLLPAEEVSASFAETLDAKVQTQKSNSLDTLAPSVPPLGLDLDPVLSESLGFVEGVREADVELLSILLPQLREALYLETGVHFPTVFVRAGVRELAPGEIVVRVNEVPVARECVTPDACLALVPPEQLRRLGIEARPARNPLNGATAAAVPVHAKAVLEASGFATWTPAGAIALYVASVLRSRATQFLGLSEVSEIVNRMEQAYPTLIRETVPKIVSLGQLTATLRILVEEGISIRDMKSILEGISAFGSSEQTAEELSEVARKALSHQLGFVHGGLEKSVAAVLLDSAIEDTLFEAERVRAIEPEIARSIIDAIKDAIRPAALAGIRPALVTSASIRRKVFELIRHDLRPVPVLSFEELPADVTLHPLARVRISG